MAAALSGLPIERESKTFTKKAVHQRATICKLTNFAPIEACRSNPRLVAGVWLSQIDAERPAALGSEEMLRFPQFVVGLLRKTRL
jgi:hypothetical protein